MMGGLITAAVKRLRTVLAAAGGSKLVGFIQEGANALARTLQDKGRERVSAEDFGAKGDGVFDCSSAVLAAVASLRKNPVVIDTGLNTGTVTSHSSGTVEFGPGVFVITPGLLDFTQDLGLTLKGKGSRGSNNSVRAATTLLVKGAAGAEGFGIRTMGNGARGLRISDMDICYADETFAGYLLDIYSTPGVSLNRVFLGTYGLSGATRLRTAAGMIRLTYDEFLHLSDVVMDGGLSGIVCDNARGPFEFGGSMTTLDNVVFYDFADTCIKQDATRSRRGLQLNNVSFNPISTPYVRAIDIGNVQGFTVNGGIAIGSVGDAAEIEWMRVLNTTGHIHGFGFGDYTKAGTFGGFLDLSNNVVDTTDGFNLAYGVITGKGNRFRFGLNGWVQAGSPATELTVDIGPDYFAPEVGNSYALNSTSAALNGRINLAKEQDHSSSGWVNNNIGVCVENFDKKTIEVTDANYNISINDSGRTIAAKGAPEVAQQFVVPPPKPGTRFRVTTTANNFTLVTSGGYPFYTGRGGVRTSLSKVGADAGCSVECVANGIDGWFVQLHGTWAVA